MMPKGVEHISGDHSLKVVESEDSNDAEEGRCTSRKFLGVVKKIEEARLNRVAPLIGSG